MHLQSDLEPLLHPRTTVTRFSGCSMNSKKLCNDHFSITEVGAMNFMIYWKNEDGIDELVTPKLDGTILPGITRDSILTLCKELNEF